MPEITDSGAEGRPIGLTDELFAFDRMVTDANMSQRTDTLLMVMQTIFENAQRSNITLTPTQEGEIRLLIAALSESEVDARTVLRFTDAEKAKLGTLDPILDAGTASQSSAQFSFPSFSGFDPSVGFTARGQFVVFTIDAVTVGALGTEDVTINFDGAVYTLTGLSSRDVPLEEFKPSTEYFALGRGLTDLILIGPNDLLEDDVIDVTNTGLPPLDEANYRKFFIDHDTPRVWVGHREFTPGTPAQGTFDRYTRTNYAGEHSSTPSAPSLSGSHYYNTTNHSWFLVEGAFPPRWRQSSFRAIFGSNASWLGEQPDDTTAANLVQNFNSGRRYLYYNTATGHVEELNTTTFVAAVSPDPHYTAEPISTPSGVSGISGVTAGIGLTGGGTSGVVTINMGVTEADFPTIPIGKGGTGAITGPSARSALGLGTAATHDVGTGAGDLPLLGGVAGLVEPEDLGGNTSSAADGDVLTYNGARQDWQTPSVVSDATLNGTGTTADPLNIPDSAITEPKLAISTAPADDQVLTWDGAAMVWASPASGAVTSNSSLSGTGLTGSPLSVDVSGAQFPVIPISKGGTASTTASDARTSLGLGTAAEANTGTVSGNVPVIDTSGRISDAIIPDGITRDTEVQGIFDTALDFATTGNTEVGINIDYDYRHPQAERDGDGRASSFGCEPERRRHSI